MKKYRKSKAKNQTYHFIKRCDERLGVQLDRKAIQRRIRGQIFDENFYLLDRQSNRVTRYRYKFQNKWYIIPYDKNTHKVITIFEDYKQDILPKISVENHNPNIINKFINWLRKFIDFIKFIFDDVAYPDNENK